ncbi:MAG: FtsW/RodA/SpoVE family cell cycle protein [Aquificae bacterium]|nr:FtsW/RodA/SpoVE family cell cycle protein [Aquificota bacterium]
MKLAEKIYPDKHILSIVLIFFIISQTFVFVKNALPFFISYHPNALLYQTKKGWKLFKINNVRYFYDLNTSRILPLPYLDVFPERFRPAREGEFETKLAGKTYKLKPYRELLLPKLKKALSKNVKLTIFFLFGLVLMGVFSRTDYRVFKNKKVIYLTVGISLALLVGVLIRKLVAPPASGMPVRWLIGTSIQPSEFSKIVLILFLAYYIGVKGYIEQFKYLLFVLLVILSHALLIALQPDLGMAFFFILLGISLMWLGGVAYRIFVPSLAVLGLAGAGIVALFFDHVKRRFEGWIDPFSDPHDKGYQIIQSLKAIAGGGLFGKGLGKGLHSAVYIRESDTDYIISLIIENLGILGFLVILYLQLLLILKLFRFANRVYGIYEKLIISGVALNIFYSIVVNYAMAFNIIPPKGIALPFLSYGVSNLLANFIGLGIVGSIYRRHLAVLNL